jgi:hypothetical protein
MIRLLIDRSGCVQSGELVDLDGRSQGQFTGWDGLTTRLRDWLRRSADAAGPKTDT